MYRPIYLEAKLRHEDRINEAGKQRLIDSLRQPKQPRRWAPPALSLRTHDLRPAI